MLEKFEATLNISTFNKHGRQLKLKSIKIHVIEWASSIKRKSIRNNFLDEIEKIKNNQNDIFL